MLRLDTKAGSKQEEAAQVSPDRTTCVPPRVTHSQRPTPSWVRLPPTSWSMDNSPWTCRFAGMARVPELVVPEPVGQIPVGPSVSPPGPLNDLELPERVVDLVDGSSFLHHGGGDEETFEQCPECVANDVRLNVRVHTPLASRGHRIRHRPAGRANQSPNSKQNRWVRPRMKIWLPANAGVA